MVNPISRTAPARPEASKPRRSPSMDAELSTARARLSDWVTCPSAKTPEGKNEIRKATEKLDTVRAAIKKADDPAAEGASGGAAGGDALSGLARSNRAAAALFGAAPRLGGHVDVEA